MLVSKGRTQVVVRSRRNGESPSSGEMKMNEGWAQVIEKVR